MRVSLHQMGAIFSIFAMCARSANAGTSDNQALQNRNNIENTNNIGIDVDTRSVTDAPAPRTANINIGPIANNPTSSNPNIESRGESQEEAAKWAKRHERKVKMAAENKARHKALAAKGAVQYTDYNSNDLPDYD